jgi:uncharacterized protein (DUF983 family)
MPVDGQTEFSPFRTGLACACPRCGKGKLYSGLLDVAEKCNACDLDYAGHDAGDGPAVFVILILGFVMVGLAAWLEFTFQPPLWVHVAVWFPFIIISSIGLLRIVKSLLIALQFRHQAGEGRVE